MNTNNAILRNPDYEIENNIVKALKQINQTLDKIDKQLERLNALQF